MCWAVRCAAFIGVPLVRNPVPRSAASTFLPRPGVIVPFSTWTRICCGATPTTVSFFFVRCTASGLSSRSALNSFPDFAGSHFTVEPMPGTGKLTLPIGTVVNSDDDGENPRIACPSSTIWSVPNPGPRARS